MTGGAALPTTVLPFVLRAVSLLGIDTVQNPIEERRSSWTLLGADLGPPVLGSSDQRAIGVDGLDAVLDEIHAGEVTSRVLLHPHR